jgi:hypothetical protein
VELQRRRQCVCSQQSGSCGYYQVATLTTRYHKLWHTLFDSSPLAELLFTPSDTRARHLSRTPDASSLELGYGRFCRTHATTGDYAPYIPVVASVVRVLTTVSKAERSFWGQMCAYEPKDLKRQLAQHQVKCNGDMRSITTLRDRQRKQCKQRTFKRARRR